MGFSDRLTDAFKGARAVLGAAELRQRLAETEQDRIQALTRLGALVHSAFEQDPGALDTRFAPAFDEVVRLDAILAEYQRQLQAVIAASAVPSQDGSAVFCSACGTRTQAGAAFCPSCGGRITM